MVVAVVGIFGGVFRRVVLGDGHRDDDRDLLWIAIGIVRIVALDDHGDVHMVCLRVLFALLLDLLLDLFGDVLWGLGIVCVADLHDAVARLDRAGVVRVRLGIRIRVGRV